MTCATEAIEDAFGEAADRDPVKVLKSFADQTGLTTKLEKRKVRACILEEKRRY